MNKVNSFRKYSMAIAEAVDAWRIVPRVLVTGYAYLIGFLVYTFVTHEVLEKTECDSAVMTVLLEKNIDVDKVTAIACQVTEFIGPPASLTTILGTLIAAATVVFGLYANSGRDWSKEDFKYWKKEIEEKKEDE